MRTGYTGRGDAHPASSQPATAGRVEVVATFDDAEYAHRAVHGAGASNLNEDVDGDENGTERKAADSTEAHTGVIQGTTQEPPIGQFVFRDSKDMRLYLFNDVLLMAKHERVSTMWG